MAARGHLVKWLRGTNLLKRVDSGSTFGSHSHYADQCVAAALLTHGVTVDACVAYSAIVEHVRRTTECHWAVAARLYALPCPTAYSHECPRMLRAAFTWRVVPCVLAARLGWVSEVRGFEPVTLLREIYLLTTSPSDRA